MLLDSISPTSTSRSISKNVCDFMEFTPSIYPQILNKIRQLNLTIMSAPKQIPLNELKRQIADKLDETLILELLDIHADELVEAFSDKIEERMEQITRQMESF